MTRAGGEAALAPFRALAEPLADEVAERPYAGLLHGGPPPRPGGPPAVVVRNGFSDAITPAGAARAISFLAAGPGMRVLALRTLGGAVADVPPDATAYAHRRAATLVSVSVAFPPPDGAEALAVARARHGSEVRDITGALGAEGHGAYVNGLGHDAQERIHDAYPGDTYARLAAAKRTYDPDNVFRRNANVVPAA